MEKEFLLLITTWLILVTDDVITHLEPDILECEVKWALESIITNRASGGDGVPVELSQILKDDAVKVLHSVCQQIWKTQQWSQDWKKVSFHSNPKDGHCQKILKENKIGRLYFLTSKLTTKLLLSFPNLLAY